MSLRNVENLVTRYKILGSGKPLLLLHGWGGSSESFYNLQKILAKRYKVITLDLPGFGQTDPPPHPWSVQDYTDFVLRFSHTLGLETFYLGGHSFGGRIAIVLTALHPERVTRLVLMASAGILHKRAPQERAIGFIATMGKRLVSLPLVNKVQKPVRSLFYRLIDRQDYFLAQGVMKETMQRVIAQDLRPYLSKISVPTLIIWGDKDTLTPLDDAYLMREEIKNSTLHIIKGASHYFPKKHYSELAIAISAFIV